MPLMGEPGDRWAESSQGACDRCLLCPPSLVPLGPYVALRGVELGLPLVIGLTLIVLRRHVLSVVVTTLPL